MGPVPRCTVRRGAVWSTVCGSHCRLSLVVSAVCAAMPPACLACLYDRRIHYLCIVRVCRAVKRGPGGIGHQPEKRATDGVGGCLSVEYHQQAPRRANANVNGTIAMALFCILIPAPKWKPMGSFRKTCPAKSRPAYPASASWAGRRAGTKQEAGAIIKVSVPETVPETQGRAVRYGAQTNAPEQHMAGICGSLADMSESPEALELLAKHEVLRRNFGEAVEKLSARYGGECKHDIDRLQSVVEQINKD